MKKVSSIQFSIRIFFFFYFLEFCAVKEISSTHFVSGTNIRKKKITKSVLREKKKKKKKGGSVHFSMRENNI